MSNADEIAKIKNAQAWDALRKFGQPLVMITMIGSVIININSQKFSNDLIQPALTFPLASLALASCVNFAEEDLSMTLRNYAFYFCKGLLVSAAIMASNPSEILFLKLNEGWMKDIFTGNMLHQIYGNGYRTLVLFHTLNLFLNKHIVKFCYGI